MNGWPPPDYVCNECDFVYSADSGGSVAVVARAIAELTQLAARTTDPALRCRSSDATWSAIEYCCHIRDVLAVSTLRLYRTRTEDGPDFEPMLNDVRARLFRYNNARVDAVLDEAEIGATALADEVSVFTPDEWLRIAHRAGQTRTATWLLRHAAHEVAHHTVDVRRAIGLTP